jgi:hypothetical protein
MMAMSLGQWVLMGYAILMLLGGGAWIIGG